MDKIRLTSIEKTVAKSIIDAGIKTEAFAEDQAVAGTGVPGETAA